MTQQIGIQLKVDTSQAVRSVKDLEKHVQGMESLRDKGDDNKGLLSRKELEQFQQMAKRVEGIYQRHYKNLANIQTELNKKLQELNQATSKGANKAQTDDLKRQIRELEARQKVFNSQNQHMDAMRRRAQQTQGEVKNYGTDRSRETTQNLAFIGRNLGLAIGAAQIFSWIREGANQISTQESSMAQIGTQVGGFGRNFAQGRLQAGRTGLPYGYTSAETIQLGGYYSSIGGANGPADLWAKTGELQREGRGLGLDPMALAGVQGHMSQLGAVNNLPQMKKFANLLAGAINNTQMGGRSQEFIQAIDSLAQSTAQGQVGLSNGQLDNVVGFMNILGQEKNWRGQQGESVAQTIDTGIKGGSNTSKILMGWGSQYAGLTGNYELGMRMAQGISNPQNIKDTLANLDQRVSSMGLTGEDAIAYKAQALQSAWGISLPQATRLLQSDMTDALNKGDYSTMNDALGLTGDQAIGNNLNNYNGSSAGQRARNEAGWSQTLQAGGGVLDTIKRYGLGLFNNQPGGNVAKWAEIGGGAYLGGSLVKGGLKAGGAGLGWLGRIFGGVAGAGAAGAAGAGAAGAGAGVAGAASAAGAGVAAGEAGLTAGGVLAGGAALAGGEASTGIGIPLAIATLAGAGLTAGGMWLYSKYKKGKSQGQGQDQMQSMSQIVQQDADNTQLRASVVEKELQYVDLEAKNIEELKKLYGAGGVGGLTGKSGATGTTSYQQLLSGMSGGNLLSKLFGGSSTKAGKWIAQITGSPYGGVDQWTDKINAASQATGDPAGIIQSIMQRESSGNPYALNNNTTGQSQSFDNLNDYLNAANSALGNGDSVDMGLMQINSAAHPDVSPEQAADPDFAINYAANLLKSYYDQMGTGNWDDAVRAYNAGVGGAQNGGGYDYLQGVQNNQVSFNDSAVANTATTNHLVSVVVSGSVDGMTNDQNQQVADAITTQISGNNGFPNLQYEWTQGVGGLA